jgi:Methylamine utilisation protein MauE
MALAVVLGVAAASKLRSPRAAAAGLATFGVPPAVRLPAMLGLAAAEALLAVGVAAGSDVAAYAAAALLALFAVVVAAVLGRGAGGAPCGCFGARSRVGVASVVRNLVLAAAFAAVPSLPSGAPTKEGWLWIGIVAAFVCIALLAVAVLALAREVGMLRLRLGAESALDVSDEGPPLGSQVDLRGRFPKDEPAPLALAIFSSDGCRLCQSLKPVIAAFTRDPLVAVEVFDEVRDADVWRELRIPGSPFAVALDRQGAVRAKGTFNTYGQLESILAAAEQGLAEARA